MKSKEEEPKKAKDSRLVVCLKLEAGSDPRVLAGQLVSLVAQTHKPDMVYVVVRKPDWSDENLQAVGKVVKDVLPKGAGGVLALEDDYGVLDVLAGPMIQTVDDQSANIALVSPRLLPPRFLESLVEGLRAFPGSAVTLAGHALGRFPAMWAGRGPHSTNRALEFIQLRHGAPVDLVAADALLVPRSLLGVDAVPPALAELQRVVPQLGRSANLAVSAWLDLLKVPRTVVRLLPPCDPKKPVIRLTTLPELVDLVRGCAALRSRGLLCAKLRVRFYQSTVLLAAVGAVVCTAAVAGLAVWAYRRSKYFLKPPQQ